MIFKFTNELSLKEAKEKRVIKKKNTFNNKVVFVNGFSASGKTMVAPIISSMQNVESLIYPYEIEWISSIYYCDGIEKNFYLEFLKQYADHTVYNQMMGRNSNLRPSDISSILQSRKKFLYLMRLFKKGDNLVPNKIIKDNPIINYTSSHLLFFINDIGEAFKKRVLFIETVRSPLYMFRQIKILFKEVYMQRPEKVFTFQAHNQFGKSFFFDFFSKDDVFQDISLNNLNELVISYLERIFEFYFNFNFSKIDMAGGKLIFLPFEKFVLHPDKWIKSILNCLEIDHDKNLSNELKKQKVPRKFLHEGLSRSVYERYGNFNYKKKFISSNDAEEDYKQNLLKEFSLGKEDPNYKRLEDLTKQYLKWINMFNDKIEY